MPTPDHIARYWKKGDHEDVVCFLCPRKCHLKEGARGFCYVRQNINGQLILTTYGRSSGFCIDPIEKKPLNHFYPGTGVLSFGTAGCNLGCKFCQNWDISKAKNTDRLNEIAPPRTIAQAAKQYECKSVAFTYNDPVIFAEYAIDVAKECHNLGIKTVAVTAGYISEEARSEFFEHMDAANIDLKAFSARFYKDFTLGSLQPVLDTLKFVKQKTKTWLEVTTLIIPGENDSPEELAQLSGWIAEELGPDTPVHFSAFHPDYLFTNHPPTPVATLTLARNIAIDKGLRYVYTGNVHDPKGASTFCHSCNSLLIERDWYKLGEYHLKNLNHCSSCHAACAGHFDAHPGHWGAKRVPVILNLGEK